MNSTKLDISLLKENPDNPRTITEAKFEALVKSVKEFPQMLDMRPIALKSASDLTVLGGNMRLRACLAAGMKEVPVIYADGLTEAQRREFIIKDNIGFGEWEWEKIIADWPEAPDWGLDIPAFALRKEAHEDDYEMPDEIETDIVLGDLFEIGPHRLLCGDSTKADDVARLMDGQKADITFTSPPYNAGNNRLGGNKNKVDSKYENSSDDDIEKWFKLVCESAAMAVNNSIFAFINLQQLANNKFRFIDFLYTVKEWFVDEMIWYKGEGNPALALGVLNSRFEKIIILKNEKFPSRAINTVKFRGTISNVYQGNQQTKNEFSAHHAATFPVHLPAHFITCFTLQSVLDLFLGSGTTMVAAHQLQRKCYGIEIDPKYCQVIIDRMKKLDPTLNILKNGVPLNNEPATPASNVNGA